MQWTEQGRAVSVLFPGKQTQFYFKVRDGYKNRAGIVISLLT